MPGSAAPASEPAANLPGLLLLVLLVLAFGLFRLPLRLAHGSRSVAQVRWLPPRLQSTAMLAFHRSPVSFCA